jgi:hypothetical protein
MSTPNLFICLDLMPKPGTPIPLDTPTVATLIQHSDVGGDGWIRNWQVFKSEAEADAYAADNPTMVKLPLELDRDARIAMG